MRIAYNIYRNDGQGGPVNYGSPVTTTQACLFSCGSPGPSSDTTFAVRAINLDSGIEEANTEARVRLVLDSSGHNITGRPGAVTGLAARVIVPGVCRVVWNYDIPPGSDPPIQFSVSLSQGNSANPADVRAMVPFDSRATGYEISLDNLPPNVTCVLAVQALGSSSWLVGDLVTVPVVFKVAQLRDVDNLTGSSST